MAAFCEQDLVRFQMGVAAASSAYGSLLQMEFLAHEWNNPLLREIGVSNKTYSVV